MHRPLPKAPALVPQGTRVRLALPLPRREVSVGSTGTVVAALKRALLAVRWDNDGALRPVNRKRLQYEENTVASKAQPQYAEFGVVTAAAIACPPGTVVRTDRECAVKLPTGQTIKFWVTAELVDDDNDVYQDLDTAALLALGIHLEPDGGSITEN